MSIFDPERVQCEYPGPVLKVNGTKYHFGRSITWPGPEKIYPLTKTVSCDFPRCKRRAKWYGYDFINGRSKQDTVYAIYRCVKHGLQHSRLPTY